MAAICGKGGKVMVSSDTVAYVENWELTINGAELSDITALGASAKSYLSCGLPSATGRISWKALDNSDTATAALRTAILAGSSVAIKLYETSAKYYDITSAYLSDLSQTVSVDGPVTGSCSFTCAAMPEYT